MIPCVFCGEPDLFRLVCTEHWGCLACERQWLGSWHNITQRWMIRVPVEQVPWASGTWADLECARRFSAQFWEDHSDAFPACCRWPKSCSAFDPGFTVGKGPTTLPVVWFDGFGWRSGPPDRSIPQHLFSDIWSRWIEVVRERNLATDPRDYWTFGPGSLPMTSPEEANDDDDNGGDEPEPWFDLIY